MVLEIAEGLRFINFVHSVAAVALHLAFSLLSTVPTFAEELVIESSSTRTHLLELFTSEGCSSCPPAEAWLNGLKNERGLWREFVAVAFHVDYWDRLGWPDRLASPLFTKRQREYATAWRAPSVYTPALVIDGREAGARKMPPASTATAGVLKVRIDGEQARVSFPAGGRKLTAHLAWLAGATENEVKAGENRGRTLKHEFVVLALESQALDGTTGLATFTTARPPAAKAVAAWITETGKLEPLQATGGALEKH